jgi:hypothetical protein
MSHTPEEMHSIVEALDLNVHVPEEAAASFSDQVVNEMSYQIALTILRDFVATYPDWAQFGQGKVTTEGIVAFLNDARNQPLAGDSLVILDQFDDRDDLANPFLIKGLELRFAEIAQDEETYHHNIMMLQIAATNVDCNHSMLAEQHIRRILSSNQTFQARLAPDSNVRQATLEWLQGMVDEALAHPLVQMAIIAGDGGVAHGALPMLPGGEVVGTQATAEILAQPDYESLLQAYQENSRLGMGVILALMTSNSKNTIVNNVTRIWGGNTTTDGSELDDLYLKDDTAG